MAGSKLNFKILIKIQNSETVRDRVKWTKIWDGSHALSMITTQNIEYFKKNTNLHLSQKRFEIRAKRTKILDHMHHQ